MNKYNHTSSTKTLCRAAMVAAASLIGLSVSSAVVADDVSFHGERIEWIVPFKEGGGSDTWARFYAPLFSHSLTGNPVVVVKNIPGGGSTKGANQFQRRASKDGLDVLGTSGSTQLPYLLGDKRVRYEYKDWIPVLATPTGGVFYADCKLGAKSLKDLYPLSKKKGLYFGSQGATSLDLVTLLALDILDINVNAIMGMKGRGAARLAFERGELNLDAQTTSGYLKKTMPLVREGKACPLMSWGMIDKDGTMQRDPNFPELPHFAEVYENIKGKKPSGEAFRVWKSFFAAGFAAQKGIFLPKGTPFEVIEEWRNAAANIVSAKGFPERSELVLGNYKQLTGDEAEVAFDIALSMTEEDKNWVRHWLNEKYQAAL